MASIVGMGGIKLLYSGSGHFHFMLVVEADQGVDDQEIQSLKGVVLWEGRGGGDEEVKGKVECRKTDGGTSDNFIDKEQVVGWGIAEEENSGLEYEG